MELELSVLLALAIVGNVTFGRFEGETPRWRRLLKWGVISGATIWLQSVVGHVAVVILLALALLGLTVHFWWCHHYGIHPLDATPRRRYYELRGWAWIE